LERLKHTIRPQVIYDYTSDQDQSDLPNFDSTDRVANENLITYSLTNSLTSKIRKTNIKRPSGERYITRSEDVESASNYNYNDFFWFKLEQSYDIDEATTHKSANQTRRPFSPLAATLQIYPGQYIAIDNESKWSVYENEFLSHNVAASLWDNRGDKFFIEHRYNRGSKEVGMDAEKSQSIYTELWLKATDKLRLFANYERNIEEDITIQTGFGFSYKSQCWSMDFRFTDRNDDEKFEFKINLNGLGGLGI
jgi:LPS-assembly protein